MTQQHDTDELLERARRALSPREADEARVLAALSERLFSAPGPADGAEIASRTLPTAPAPPPLRALRWLWKGVLPLTAAGALGLFVHAQRDREPPRAARPAPVQPAPRQAAVQLPSPPRLALDQPSAPSAPAPAEPAKPDRKKPARKKCHAANGGEQPCPARPAPTALASSEAPPVAPPVAAASSLRQELDALRSAERALREHRPQDALTTLETFERTLTGSGAMQEERAAAATIARCTLATTGRPALASTFMNHYPASAYAARIRQICQRP